MRAHEGLVTRLVLDASFTSGFDEWTALVAALAWVLALGVSVSYLFTVTRTH